MPLPTSKNPWITLLALFFGLLSVQARASETPEQRFTAVRAAFDKGDFTKAQYLAEAMVKDGQLSPELFQLLGHARYRQSDLGRASLWYQRAALFPPPVPEVRQNIAHIHDRTGNVAFPSNSFTDQLSAWLSRSQWLRVAIMSGWIIMIAVTLSWLYVKSSALRAFLLTAASLALIAGMIAIVCWSWRPNYESLKDLAVITAPNTHAYTGASTTSGSVIDLHVGSEVKKLENRGAWTYVEIPTDVENRRGWVQNEALTAFWPFDPGYLE